MKIAEIDEADRHEIQRLYERHLNSGPGIQTYFDGLFSVKDWLGVKGIQDGKITAVFLCSEGGAFTVPHPALLKKVRDVTGTDAVYTVDIIYTDPDYRHNGIQTIFSTLTIKALSARGVRWLLFEHWIQRGQTEPDFGLLHTDCVELGSFPDFYRELQDYRIMCPICGVHCTCGAKIILYRIKPANTADYSEI